MKMAESFIVGMLKNSKVCSTAYRHSSPCEFKSCPVV
jgi:hypothetical protein